MHIAFGMDDIDEVMLGANIMDAKGWKSQTMNSRSGISRHRISSAIYYYCDMPGKAGEAEYHADTDYLGDNWVPRGGDFRFGSLLWSNNAPPVFRGDNIPRGMAFDARQLRTLSQDRHRQAGRHQRGGRTCAVRVVRSILDA